MHNPRFNTFQIRTPEGVTFSLALAGPVARCLAWLVDVLAVVVLGVGVSMLLALVGWLSEDLAQAATVVAWFFLQIGYGLAFEWGWRGQTPGKRLLRLQVADAEGLRLSFSQVVMRNLLRSVDCLPGLYLVGGVAAWSTRRFQRLGDLAANTVVIRQARVFAPDWSGLERGKYNSLLRVPQLVARLRQRMDPEAAYLGLRALMRRQELDPEARVEVFREAARYFRGVVRFPEDLVGGLSDEQWVRNVVESAFRAGETGSRSSRESNQR